MRLKLIYSNKAEYYEFVVWENLDMKDSRARYFITLNNKVHVNTVDGMKLDGMLGYMYREEAKQRVDELVGTLERQFVELSRIALGKYGTLPVVKESASKRPIGKISTVVKNYNVPLKEIEQNVEIL